MIRQASGVMGGRMVYLLETARWHRRRLSLSLQTIGATLVPFTTKHCSRALVLVGSSFPRKKLKAHAPR